MSRTVDGDSVRRVGPDGGPPVLLLHPWWGVTEAVIEWADILAKAGRRVVVPDLYGGKTADTVQEAQALQAAMDEAAAIALMERCADELAAQEHAWAAMGFSMGGSYACHLAGRAAAGPHELVLFYGGWPPQGTVSRTHRVALHVVPDDEYFTGEEITATEDAFRAAGAEIQIYRYPDSRHWFAERDSPAFDEAAYTLARSRVIEQLGG